MDHLPLPRKPTILPDRVPYFGLKYDEGNFLTYPSRLPQWKHALDGSWRYSFAYNLMNHQVGTRELETFAQSWLFGLLHATLGTLYDHDDFTEVIDGRFYVHTRLLVERLEQLAQQLPLEDDLLTLSNHINDCLYLTETILAAIKLRHGFASALRTSIVSVYGLITGFGEMHFERLGERDWVPKEGMFDDFSAEDVEHMIVNGWCPFAIYRLRTAAPSLALNLYCKSLDMYNPDGVDHTRCRGARECSYATVDESYSCQHVCEKRNCPMIGPNVDDVHAVLESGSYPVLDILRDSLDSMKLDVLSRQEDTAYVAISHVWTHGLGNPSSLTLPSCQLQRLRRYVNALHGRTFRYRDYEQTETRQLYIWIDPLLVPIEAKGETLTEAQRYNNRMRDLAMTRMRDVYYDATYVLALDRGLEAISYAEHDAFELTARIHTSAWSGRMWTLQEGALPMKLLVQFKDIAADFFDLHNEVRKAYSEDLRLRRLCGGMLIRSAELRRARFLMPKEQSIVLTFRALSLRGVSNPVDQVICAAALLGLDLGQVSSVASLEDKMQVFWRLVCQSEIPIYSALAFSKMKKLDMPGYRWAPASVINKSGFSSTTLGSGEALRPARLIDEGLCVQVSAWRVRGAPAVSSMLRQDFLDADAGNKIDMYMRTEAGLWLRAVDQDDVGGQLGLLDNGRDKDWVMLLDRTGRDHHTVIESRLGPCTVLENGVQLVRPEGHMFSRALSPQHTIIVETAYEHAQALRSSYNHWMQEFWHARMTELQSLPMLGYLAGAAQSLQESCQRKVHEDLESRCKLERQTLPVQEAMEAVDSSMKDVLENREGAESFLRGHIWSCYYSRYVEIAEEYEETTEWCVD